MTQQKKPIQKVFFSVTGVILLGKLLGFIKQMIIAANFGTTRETDILSLSEGFIGNIQYVIVQVLLTAFTTIYIVAKEESSQKAKTLAADTIKAAFLISLGIIFFLMVSAGKIARIIAPSYDTADSAQLAAYLRLFAPLLAGFVFIAIARSLLNAHHRFAPGECITLNQNIIMIVLVGSASSFLGTKVLAVGLWICTIFNAAFLGLLVRHYYGGVSKKPFANPAMKTLVRMAFPLLLSYSMVYINQQVDKILSSSLEVGTVTAVGYAAMLSDLIATVICSLCSVLFTYITTHVANNEGKKAADLSVRASLLLCAIFLPVSILTVFCAEDVVTIVFGRGAFSANSIQIASNALAGYAFAFVPRVFQEIFSRFQYSYQDTKQPMVNSTLSIVVNIVLSIILCPRLGVFGITFASSISVAICSILNFKTARQKNALLQYRPLIRCLPFFMIGSIVCLMILRWGVHIWQAQSALIRFILITLSAGGGYALIVAPWIIKSRKEDPLRKTI